MGDWHEIQAVRATMDHPIEVEDVSMALVRFENQALGNITNSVVSPRFKVTRSGLPGSILKN